MADEVFHFVWEVPEDGFRFETTKEVLEDEEDIFLVHPAPIGTPYRLKRYMPLEEFTGLFKIFAKTKLDHDGVLEFANKYGTLTRGSHIRPPSGSGPVLAGEPLRLWYDHIDRVKRLLDLWCMLRKEDTAALKKHIKWSNGRVDYQSYVGEKPPRGQSYQVARIASEEVYPHIFERFERGNVILPAWYHLQREMNKNLQEQVSPRLLWHEEDLRLFFWPKDLLGAIWLQFAQAVSGNRKYRSCAECGTVFELSPQSARRNRIYCSDSCKMTAYRKRKLGGGS